MKRCSTEKTGQFEFISSLSKWPCFTWQIMAKFCTNSAKIENLTLHPLYHLKLSLGHSFFPKFENVLNIPLQYPLTLCLSNKIQSLAVKEMQKNRKTTYITSKALSLYGIHNDFILVTFIVIKQESLNFEIYSAFKKLFLLYSMIWAKLACVEKWKYYKNFTLLFSTNMTNIMEHFTDPFSIPQLNP